MAEGFVLVRDPRGSLVHVRNARTGECIGCVEAGLFELIRAALSADAGADAREGRRRPLEEKPIIERQAVRSRAAAVNFPLHQREVVNDSAS